MTTSTKPEHNLGSILHRILLVRSGDIVRALAERTEGQRLGEALVAAGVITDSELRIALEVQAGLRSDDPSKRAEAASRMAALAVMHAAHAS